MAILGKISKIFLFIFLFPFVSKHVNAAFFPTLNTYYGCQNGTFESSQQNTLGVTSLLSDLVSHASTQSFYNSSSSASGQNNIVYGIFYCTGNVNSTECHRCVRNAADALEANCNNYKAAIVYKKECTLRYSNNTVYGDVDDSSSWLYSLAPVYYSQFNQTVYSTLDKVMKQAYSDANSKGFATTDVGLIQTSQRLYALAQCSPDIFGTPCRDCLERALNLMPDCCNNSIERTSITTLLSSCQLGFEVKYPSTSDGTPSPAGNNVWYIMLALLVAAIALN